MTRLTPQELADKTGMSLEKAQRVSEGAAAMDHPMANRARYLLAEAKVRHGRIWHWKKNIVQIIIYDPRDLQECPGLDLGWLTGGCGEPYIRYAMVLDE